MIFRRDSWWTWTGLAGCRRLDQCCICNIYDSSQLTDFSFSFNRRNLGYPYAAPYKKRMFKEFSHMEYTQAFTPSRLAAWISRKQWLAVPGIESQNHCNWQGAKPPRILSNISLKLSPFSIQISLSDGKMVRAYSLRYVLHWLTIFSLLRIYSI